MFKTGKAPKTSNKAQDDSDDIDINVDELTKDIANRMKEADSSPPPSLKEKKIKPFSFQYLDEELSVHKDSKP